MALPRFAIKNARIFDGERQFDRQTLVVEDGAVAALGHHLELSGIDIIDGSGCTILPGLIDSHVHIHAKEQLSQAITFGITTQLDMFMDVELARTLKMVARSGGPRFSDLLSAGNPATSSGGHCTQFGKILVTIDRQEDADGFVAERIEEGSDYIKVIYDDCSTYGFSMPTLDLETLSAVIRASRRRGKLTVAHIGSYQQALDSASAGASGLGHLFVDRIPDAGFAELLRKKGTFVIPTLTALQSICGIAGGGSLSNCARLKKLMTAENIEELQTSFPSYPGRKTDLEAAFHTIAELVEWQVPILAGSDASAPGTTHGASLHHELELLVYAGLTPAQALAAATSVPARVFNLSDRGRIAAGLRADLLLVEGDPTGNILDTRNISRVWKQGELTTNCCG